MPIVRRQYEIDLSRPASERWAEMIASECGGARELIGGCIQQMELKAGSGPIFAAKKLLPAICRLCGDNLGGDLDAWAAGAGINRRDLLLANLSYELAQAGIWGSGLIAKARGWLGWCTAAAFELPRGQGIAHIRNMDWPLLGCGPRTVLIHYTGARGPFTTVGWPGYVSVLSGIAPGRFSATINMAPMAGPVTLHWPASFALRRVFEECSTFAEAVEALRRFKLSAPALFLLAGTRPGEAVVIEHLAAGCNCRWMKDGVLAVSNHYLAPGFVSYNPQIEPAEEGTVSPQESSQKRFAAALSHAKRAKGRALTPAQMLQPFNHEPVRVPMTAQQMAFVPRTGQYHAVWRDTDEAVADSFVPLL